MAAPAEIVTGTVVKVKGQGFVLAGREGWLNISRYADPKPELPDVGQHVKLSLDSQGFVRTLEVASTQGETPRVGHSPSFAPALLTPGVTVSLRIAALSAAAGFLAHRPEARSTDVEALAERWEGWLSH